MSEPVATIRVKDGCMVGVEKHGETPPDGVYHLVPANASAPRAWRAKIVGVTGANGLTLKGEPGSLNGWTWDGRLQREVEVRIASRVPEEPRAELPIAWGVREGKTWQATENTEALAEAFAKQLRTVQAKERGPKSEVEVVRFYGGPTERMVPQPKETK